MLDVQDVTALGTPSEQEKIKRKQGGGRKERKHHYSKHLLRGWAFRYITLYRNIEKGSVGCKVSASFLSLSSAAYMALSSGGFPDRAVFAVAFR